MLELLGVEALKGIDSVLVADGLGVGAALQKHVGHIADLPDRVSKQLPVAAMAAAAVAQLGACLLHFAVQLRQMTGRTPFHQLLQLLWLLRYRQRLHHPSLFLGGKHRLGRPPARKNIIGQLAKSLRKAVDHVTHFLFAALAENKAHDDGEDHHCIADTNHPLHGKTSFNFTDGAHLPPLHYLPPEGGRPAGE